MHNVIFLINSCWTWTELRFALAKSKFSLTIMMFQLGITFWWKIAWYIFYFSNNVFLINSWFIAKKCSWSHQDKEFISRPSRPLHVEVNFLFSLQGDIKLNIEMVNITFSVEFISVFSMDIFFFKINFANERNYN